jgi:hypothetical protein
MTGTMRWLILLPAGPGALPVLLASTSVALGPGFSASPRWRWLASWRLPVIRSVRTLPTLKAEAVTHILLILNDLDR